MKAGVIGHPVSHSKSPVIHEYWLEEYGLKGYYEAIDIEPENFEKDIQRLIDEGYDGFNVTVPYKEKIIPLCDKIDGNAQQIGAVNTIIIENGKLVGRNTDAFGFIANLKAHHVDFKGKKALILGAGGAARAAIFGLLQEGIDKIWITNRTKEKAEALKVFAPDKIDVVDWPDKTKFLKEINLLVNTTSLGMQGKPYLEMDLTGLPQNSVVTDVVYAPLMTELLKQAENDGHKIVTGIGMLLHQARPAFEAWTGKMPDVTEELERLVLA
jgi:shikimate dehydrogenase